MRYFDFHRRRLASKKHIIGTPSTVSGTDSVMLKATSGSKISKLEIGGNTYQYQAQASANRADPSYFSNSENYSSGGTGIYYIALPSYITEKEITFSLKEKSSLTGIKIAASDDTSPIFASAYSVILKSDGTTSTATGSTFKYLVVTRTVIDDDYSLPAWWESYDLQIELGTEATEYVPFTVPITTPSHENPSAVSNSNDNGMVVTLQGKNLFDKNSATFSVGYYNNDGIYTASATGSTMYLNEFISVIPSTSYFSGFLGGYKNATLAIYFYDKNKNWISRTTKFYNETNNKPFGAFVTPDNCYFIRLQILYAKGDIYCFNPENYQLEIGTEATEYEPYFNKTVQIPSSVVLPDGTSLEMRLAKVGDKADRLIVDRNQGKVTYEKNVGYKKPPASQGFGRYNTKYEHGVLSLMLEQSLWRAKGYCTYEKVTGTEQGKMWLGVGNPYVYWIGILDRMGMTLDEFKEWFAEIQSGDSPFIIEYALESPVEYDITDTDFAKELLSLETLHGCDLTLKAGADIAPSSIVCEYYSLENEDRQTVTVRCEKADGASLCEPCLHEVRKNTLYTVKSPEIDGYVSEKPSESADASITTEIKFTYTEAEK